MAARQIEGYATWPLRGPEAVAFKLDVSDGAPDVVRLRLYPEGETYPEGTEAPVYEVPAAELVRALVELGFPVRAYAERAERGNRII